ncbi:MAG: tetratricopeptide repeat protein [Planctomycetes bacterium]|nr:tetratricopeptide repeat protein [Planctomycetota bacterium]
MIRPLLSLLLCALLFSGAQAQPPSGALTTRLELCMSALKSGRYLDAIRFADKVLDHEALQPSLRAVALNVRGLALIHSGNAEAALPDFTLAISCLPDSAPLRINRALAYSKLGAVDEALADYEKALEQAPILAFTNQFDHVADQDALDQFRAVIQAFAPLRASAYYRRGLLNEGQSRYEEAVGDYTMALDCQPARAEAYLHRGSVLISLNRIGEGMKDLDYAIAQEDDLFVKASALEKRGIIAYEDGHHASAVRDLSRSLELQPENIYANYYRALAFSSSMRYQQALRDLNTVIGTEGGGAPARPRASQSRQCLSISGFCGEGQARLRLLSGCISP